MQAWLLEKYAKLQYLDNQDDVTCVFCHLDIVWRTQLEASDKDNPPDVVNQRQKKGKEGSGSEDENEDDNDDDDKDPDSDKDDKEGNAAT